jgi:hypothetical protein
MAEPTQPVAQAPDQTAQTTAQAPDPTTAPAPTTTTAAVQPVAHPNALPMMSPDYKSVKMVPPDQQDDAKKAGWEPAAKMSYNQSLPFQSTPFGTKKWVPASQLDEARKQNWMPVLTDQQKAAQEADSITPSVSGNAAIMLAPLAIPDAVTGALEEAFNPVAEQLVDKGGLAKEYVEYFGKQAGQKAIESGVQAAKWMKANPVQSAMLYHAARSLGIPLPKVLDLFTKIGAE